jgi:hypothetical protein
MSNFSPWGGLGGPGGACVKCGGKETTLGYHPPTREALPKKQVAFPWYIPSGATGAAGAGGEVQLGLGREGEGLPGCS